MAEPQSGGACKTSELSRVEEGCKDNLITLGFIVLEVLGRMGILFGKKTHMSVERSTQEQTFST